jgi:hypothetical protein
MRGPARFPYLGGGAPPLSHPTSRVDHVARSAGDDLGVLEHQLGERLIASEHPTAIGNPDHHNNG